MKKSSTVCANLYLFISCLAAWHASTSIRQHFFHLVKHANSKAWNLLDIHTKFAGHYWVYLNTYPKCMILHNSHLRRRFFYLLLTGFNLMYLLFCVKALRYIIQCFYIALTQLVHSKCQNFEKRDVLNNGYG